MTTATVLSNLKCQKATPKAKPYRIPNNGGLALLVTPEGGKLWRWRYRFNGAAKQMALGKYPDVPLTDARLRHAEARKLLASGVGPMAVRTEAKHVKRAQQPEAGGGAAKEYTFADLAKDWFEWWVKGKNPKYAKNVGTRLKGDITDEIRGKLPGGDHSQGVGGPDQGGR